MRESTTNRCESSVTASAADRWAVDTSVAVASLDPTHEAHTVCRAVAQQRRPALSGHAVFETFSVLTRLPGDLRVSAETALDLLDRAYPERCWMGSADHDARLTEFAAREIVGGMVYDALVGAAAMAHGRILLTRDRRASRTYDAIGARYQFVD